MEAFTNLQAVMFKYLFLVLFSGWSDDSAVKSSLAASACMASYSLLKPMSPSACSWATCLLNILTGIAFLTSPFNSPGAFQSKDAVGTEHGGSSK